MANWFIRRHNDFDEGPLSASELKARAASGKLRPSDRIRREDTNNYVAASSVRGLFNEVAPSSPPNKTSTNQTKIPLFPVASKNKIDLTWIQKAVFATLGVFFLTSGCIALRWLISSPSKVGKSSQIDSSKVNDIGAQLVELNQKIGDWKSKREKMESLLRNLEQDKYNLVSQLRQLGASPTDQKSSDPKGAVLLSELRDVLKQSIAFDKKHKDYDLAIFKSESRVRTFERRIAAKEVAGTDEELTALVRSMTELDESLDAESKDEIPIELDDLVKNSLAATPDSWKKNSLPEEQPKPVKQDGIPLFGGSLLDNWESESFSPPSNWTLFDGILTCNRDGPSLVSRRKFKDFDLHMEFLLPPTAATGVFLRGRYEVQLLDSSYRLPNGQPVSNIGSHGSIWGLIAPSEISYAGPNQWNSLDVRLRDRNVTVTLNDKTVIRDQRIDRPTAGAIDRDESTPGPIVIQSSTTPGVQFRNAWIKPDPFTPGAFGSGAVPIDKAKANEEPMRVKASSVVLPKPVLYLPCDGTPTQTYVKVSGGRYVEGAIGKGLYYDGNQHTEIIHALPLGNSPRTLALWVRNGRDPTARNVHIITFGPGESAKPFGLMEANLRWRFFDLNGGLDSGVFVDKEWHHHVLTHDGFTIRYYIDGKEVQKDKRKLSTANGSLMIGGIGDRAGNFVGTIDEIYFFDSALSDSQVYKLFWMR